MLKTLPALGAVVAWLFGNLAKTPEALKLGVGIPAISVVHFSKELNPKLFLRRLALM